MNVVSIQSQVAFGHVGNSAAAFPMQLAGIDVIQVPTTLLSNRPGYPTLRGRILDAELVAELLAGIEERGVLDDCAMILSGYLGSAETGAAVADFVIRARRRNPALAYACDPVLGDRDRGLFVRPGVPELVRDRLCPLADLITPNHFEFETLCGVATPTIPAVIDQARRLIARGRRQVVVTSAELADTPEGAIETLAITGDAAWRLATPRLPIAPSGTGDLFAGLLVSALVRGAALPDALAEAGSAIHAVLETTRAAGTAEMRIVAAAAGIVRPPRRFEAVKV